MMRKVKITTWNSSDNHVHPLRKTFSQGWVPIQKHIPERIIPVTDQLAECSYPRDVLNLFWSAVLRCPQISMDSAIMQGQPCIAGTRIPVRSILRVIEQYGSVGDVKRCYPHLTTEQVEDALYFSQIILELPSGPDKSTAPAR
jgi:uncharacterized protein (DUF433 family)